MSVISRMLRDLESRDAPVVSPRDANDLPRRFSPGPERPRGRRKRGRLRRAGTVGLAALLMAVAAALWWQRAPALWALVAPVRDGAPERIGAAPSEPVPEPPPARLATIRFTGSAREAALELTITGKPPEQPGYARRGDVIAVRVPAPADGLAMPMPPADQAVFRTATLQTGGKRGSTIQLGVAAGASFDLERVGGRLTLTGRLPPEPEPEPAQTDKPPPAPKRAAPDRSPAEPAATAPAPSAADAGTAERAPQEGGADAVNGMRKQDRSAPAVRADRRYREAQRAYAGGDVGQARRLLRAALALDADLHRARDLLAALHRRAGEAGSARDVLAEGVERAPGRPEYAKPLARLLVDTDALERAARVLDAAARGARGDADFHGLAAAIAQRRGRHEEAASAYGRALDLDAANGRWWLGLGVSLAAADHPHEARAAFREARNTGSLPPRLDAWARSRIQALSASGD